MAKPDREISADPSRADNKDNPHVHENLIAQRTAVEQQCAALQAQLNETVEVCNAMLRAKDTEIAELRERVRLLQADVDTLGTTEQAQKMRKASRIRELQSELTELQSLKD